MDRDQLRRLADTRPGYATYPDTRPGSPSWWRRPLPDQQGLAEAVATIPAPAPPPIAAPAAVVDEQHTWTTDDVELVCKALGIPVQPWQALLIRQLFAEPPSRVRPAGIAGRRWWHRIIRRADR